jgi:hypothetical protein
VVFLGMHLDLGKVCNSQSGTAGSRAQSSRNNGGLSMGSSINSIDFLWAAYIVVVLANVGFVARLIRRANTAKAVDRSE